MFSEVRRLMHERGCATIEDCLSEAEWNDLRDRIAKDHHIPIQDLDRALTQVAGGVAEEKRLRRRTN